MFCKNCGKKIADNSTRCAYCGNLVIDVVVTDDASAFIPNNRYALIAYYCGIGSLFSCIPMIGVITLGLSIIAILQGIKGVKYAKENNGVGIKHALFGIVLGTISAIIGIFMAIGSILMLLDR